jgi:hypothetical protein
MAVSSTDWLDLGLIFIVEAAGRIGSTRRAIKWSLLRKTPLLKSMNIYIYFARPNTFAGKIADRLFSNGLPLRKGFLQLISVSCKRTQKVPLLRTEPRYTGNNFGIRHRSNEKWAELFGN